MKRIFRFRQIKLMPFDIEEIRKIANNEIRKNYIEGIFNCGDKPNILITKEYKNEKLM